MFRLVKYFSAIFKFHIIWWWWWWSNRANHFSITYIQAIFRFHEFWLKLFTLKISFFARAHTTTTTTTNERRQQNLVFYTENVYTFRWNEVNEDWEEKIELNLIRSLDIHLTVFAMNLPLHHCRCPSHLYFFLYMCRSLRFWCVRCHDGKSLFCFAWSRCWWFGVVLQ